MTTEANILAALRQRLADWPADTEVTTRLAAGERVRFLLELTEPDVFWPALGASAMADHRVALQHLELTTFGLFYVVACVDGTTLLQLASLPGVGRVDVDEPVRMIDGTGGDDDGGN